MASNQPDLSSLKIKTTRFRSKGDWVDPISTDPISTGLSRPLAKILDLTQPKWRFLVFLNQPKRGTWTLKLAIKKEIHPRNWRLVKGFLRVQVLTCPFVYRLHLGFGSEPGTHLTSQRSRPTRCQGSTLTSTRSEAKGFSLWRPLNRTKKKAHLQNENQIRAVPLEPKKGTKKWKINNSKRSRTHTHTKRVPVAIGSDCTTFPLLRSLVPPPSKVLDCHHLLPTGEANAGHGGSAIASRRSARRWAQAAAQSGSG